MRKEVELAIQRLNTIFILLATEAAKK